MSETATNLTPVTPVTSRRAVTVTSNVDMVQAALKSGNIEIYREAVALFKELEGMAARKAFDNAMADAKAQIPVIRKNRRVFFESQKAGAKATDYRHEDMAEIARTIDPILSEHGLSYRFRVSSEINQPVRVICVVSHRDGHFEETALSSGKDDGPGRNAIQQIGSTITYLQRYTLKAALGLAASEDDDGRASEAPGGFPGDADNQDGRLTPAECAHLRSLLKQTGCPEKNFLIAAKKPRIEDILNVNYDRCVDLINRYTGKHQS